MIFFYINKKLIAWSELQGCETLDRLITAVHEAAKQDDPCNFMMQQAKQRFGIWFPEIEPNETGDLIAKDVMDALVRDTFYYFAHPSIGNVGRLQINAAGRQIPMPRDVDLRPPAARRPRPIWATCTDLEDTTRNAIEQLIKSQDFARFDSMARDQVRVVHNTTELARAIFGEICCTGTKRLEKILALRLCGSKRLFGVLNTLLQSFMVEWFSRMPMSQIKFEYIIYYFAILETKLLQTDANDYRSYFLRALACTCDIETAELSDPRATVRQRIQALAAPPTDAEIDEIETNIVTTWLHLPPVIRCIMLLNDFRVLWETDLNKDINVIVEKLETVTLCVDNATLENSYLRVSQHADDIIAEFKGLPYLYSWNRYEAVDSTVAYRKNLCPLWAGPSAHVTRLFAFWQAADLNKEFDAAALATALFAFWRLYYDKRVSAAHVFVESVEQTYTWLWDALEDDLPYGSNAAYVPLQIENNTVRDMSDDRDVFDDVQSCCVSYVKVQDAGKDALNPFMLLSLLERNYFAAAAQQGATTAAAKYDWLWTKISTLRSGLEKRGYFVPQWTWDFTTNGGLTVRRVEMLHTAIHTALEGVLDDPTTLALIARLVGNPGPVEAPQ